MASPWTIAGEIARLRIGKLTAELKLALPQRGLHNVAMDGAPLGDAAETFLGVHTQPLHDAEQIQDCYVRGADLVVTYAETPERNIRPQVYWRAVAFPEEQSHAFGVDVILSTQTSRLYSDPTMFVESFAPASGEAIAVAGVDGVDVLLLRSVASGWSFAQAIHPSDFNSVEASPTGDGRTGIRHRLFAPGLEKGVIRRARLRGLFVPRERDEELTAASYAEFVAQELPLTT